MKMNDRIRIITKEGRKWKSKHSDGQITYHKTKKAAKEYEHDMYVINPFVAEYMELLQHKEYKK